MSKNKLSTWEVLSGTAIVGLSSALGTATFAAIRNSSIKESASIAGIGNSILLSGVVFFAKPSSNPPPFNHMHFCLGFGIFNIIGNLLGYTVAKSLNSTTSTAPLVNGILGLPVSISFIHGLIKMLEYFFPPENKYQKLVGDIGPSSR